jgi:hypothetical protein
VATFEGTDVEWMYNEMKQNPPQSMPEGLRGGLSLVDAGGGRQLFISLFDTREQIEAAEPTFERMGDEIPEDVQGRRVSKEYYEVAFGVVQLA